MCTPDVFVRRFYVIFGPQAAYRMEPTTHFITDRYGAPTYAGQRMDKADFLRWESDDNYVYEYNDGLLEPTTSMRQDENRLLTHLENVFFKTEAFKEGDRLRPEMDCWLTEKQMRRPDVAYYSAAHLSLMDVGERVVPSFVIEFSSENDDTLKDLKKLHEYFNAGVQVVWWVYPVFDVVYAYTSPKAVTICTDNDILSAAPALPELQMTVAELFRR